jgi:cytochrome c oxidase assembly factor CtaG
MKALLAIVALIVGVTFGVLFFPYLIRLDFVGILWRLLRVAVFVLVTGWVALASPLSSRIGATVFVAGRVTRFIAWPLIALAYVGAVVWVYSF